MKLSLTIIITLICTHVAWFWPTMPSVYTQVFFCNLLCCLLNFSVCIKRILSEWVYRCTQTAVVTIHKCIFIYSEHCFWCKSGCKYGPNLGTLKEETADILITAVISWILTKKGLLLVLLQGSNTCNKLWKEFYSNNPLFIISVPQMLFWLYCSILSCALQWRELQAADKLPQFRKLQKHTPPEQSTALGWLSEPGPGWCPEILNSSRSHHIPKTWNWLHSLDILLQSSHISQQQINWNKRLWEFPGNIINLVHFIDPRKYGAQKVGISHIEK